MSARSTEDRSRPATDDLTTDDTTVVAQDNASSEAVDTSKGVGEIMEKPAASQGPPPPPNGGLKAWLQVAGGALISVNTWGLLNSFGVFQTYYVTNLLQGQSDSNVSWIGTIQSCFILIGTLYSGPLFDWGYARTLIAFGSFMIVFGMFMTSLCHEYWQLILAQGLTIGIGLGCLFIPTAGLVAQYFSTKRGLAMGIVSSGTTLGGVIYPIVFNRLAGPVGFGWATRTIAFIMLFILAFPVLILRQRLVPPAVRKAFDKTAIKEPQFTLFALALFVSYAGQYIPYFYIQLYAVELGIITGPLNFYLLPLINAAGLFGRVTFGWLADRYGPMNFFILANFACAILLFGWMGIFSEAGVVIFTLLYGFFSAGLITLPATIVAQKLCPDLSKYGVRMTMQCIPSGIGLLIGNPIAGAIVAHSWRGLQGFAAGTVLISAVLSIFSRAYISGWNPRTRC